MLNQTYYHRLKRGMCVICGKVAHQVNRQKCLNCGRHQASRFMTYYHNKQQHQPKGKP